MMKSVSEKYLLFEVCRLKQWQGVGSLEAAACESRWEPEE